MKGFRVRVISGDRFVCSVVFAENAKVRAVIEYMCRDARIADIERLVREEDGPSPGHYASVGQFAICLLHEAQTMADLEEMGYHTVMVDRFAALDPFSGDDLVVVCPPANMEGRVRLVDRDYQHG